jgi:hypothetical protein
MIHLRQVYLKMKISTELKDGDKVHGMEAAGGYTEKSHGSYLCVPMAAYQSTWVSFFHITNQPLMQIELRHQHI